MTTSLRDYSCSFFLHTDLDGVVWHRHAGRSDAIRGYSVADLFLSTPLSGNDIYILGSKQNASLVCNAMRACDSGLVSQVYIGSPWLLQARPESSHPAEVLNQYDEVFNAPSTVGGWHRADAMDRATFCLIAEEANPEDSHPVCRFLSALGNLSKADAAECINHLVDPRWHLAPRSRVSLGMDEYRYFPDVSKYMGLTARTFFPLHAGVRKTNAFTTRAALVWRMFEQLSGDVKSYFESAADRQVLREGELDLKKLLACQEFLRLLLAYWMNHSSTSNEWFTPEGILPEHYCRQLQSQE